MSQSPIRLLIADDMLPIREYLSMILSNESDMEIVDAVSTGTAIVERVLATHPDVVLLDLEMEKPGSGIEAIKTIAIQAPDVHSVALTLFNDDDTIFTALKAGASDYVLKSSSTGEILEAVRAAAKNIKKSPLKKNENSPV